MLYLFGFGPILYVCVLLLNAVAILSEDRFLARIGWATLPSQGTEPSFGGPGANDPESFKSKGIHLISSIRMLFRVPLIAVNSFLIMYELLLG